MSILLYAREFGWPWHINTANRRGTENLCSHWILLRIYLFNFLSLSSLLWLSLSLSLLNRAWIDVLKGGMIGAVFAFYGVVALFIIVPFRCNRWLRRATALVLGRCWELINPRCHCIHNDGTTPPRIIPFVDVFFADAMCSLSKVFFDWGMLLHSK